MAGDLKEVGVEALVKGLQSFLGDMGKINSSLDSTRSHGNLLTNMFEAVGQAIGWFGQQVLDVAKYALGQLLADAIRAVIELFKELVAGVMESADSFQKMEIRLERLNFNALTDSGMEYNEAMTEAARLTKEQLDWTIKLAAQTPYDAVDVANIYTLARGYGFTAEEAKGLTESVISFTAGMGLTNVELERIIINFGQLRQQGKLNGQELRDLARGAFVPINAVLEITAEKLGMTIEEFNELRASGKLSAEAVDVFRQSFEELVGVKFEGAAQALGNVFSVAIENVKGLIQDMLGLYVVAPVLLTIGGYIQDISNAIVDNDARWNKLVESLKAIGATITLIVVELFGLAPSADSIAQGIVDAVSKISDWLAEHRHDIVDFFENIITIIRDKVVPFIVDKLIPAIAKFVDWVITEGPGIWETFERIGKTIYDWVVTAVEKISKWVEDNGPLISEFFSSLGEIIGDVFEGLTGKEMEGGGSFLDTLLELVKGFMEFLVENKETIAVWVENLIRFYIAWQVLSGIFQIVVGVITTVIGALLSLAAGILFLLTPLGLVTAAVTLFFAGWLSDIVRFGEAQDRLSSEYRDKELKKQQEWNAEVLAKAAENYNANTAALEEHNAEMRASYAEWGASVRESISSWWDGINTLTTEKRAAQLQAQKEWGEKVRASFADTFNKALVSTERGMTNIWNSISTWGQRTWQSISEWFGKVKDTVAEKIQQAYDFVKNMHWYTLGTDIINGMIQGVVSGASTLINAVVSAALDAYNAAMALLGINSPSKLFAELGVFTMEGMAIGIEKAAGLATNAMERAVSQMAMPAMSLPSVAQGAAAPQTNYNSTRNFNLNINTSANTEPIISDFNMMESLAG